MRPRADDQFLRRFGEGEPHGGKRPAEQGDALVAQRRRHLALQDHLDDGTNCLLLAAQRLDFALDGGALFPGGVALLAVETFDLPFQLADSAGALQIGLHQRRLLRLRKVIRRMQKLLTQLLGDRLNFPGDQVPNPQMHLAVDAVVYLRHAVDACAAQQGDGYDAGCEEVSQRARPDAPFRPYACRRLI